VLAHVFLKLLALPLRWESADVDVGVVALLEALLPGHEVLCLQTGAVEHFAGLSSDRIDGLFGLFGVAELDKSISFARLLALFGFVADFDALDLTELGEVFLKLCWDHRCADVLNDDVASDVHEVAVV